MIDWIAEPLSHGTTVRALVEIIILGAISGAVGCWVVLYEVSYSAESLAHGMFPGLVGAALLGVPLLLGGAVGIIIAALLIAIIGRFADDAADTAIAIVVTTLFGLGVLMALSPESPPGIQSLLFGDLLGVGDGQLAATAAIAIAVLGVLWLFHDRLLAVGFSRDAGPSLGLSPGIVTALLLALVAVTVLVGVQGLGNLLVAAILVGPAAAARLVSRRIGPMMLTAVVIAVVSGIVGIYASYYLRTAAGASVVVALLACYLVAAAVAAVPSRPRLESVRVGS
ncbi:MAG: metal ABC transporter permease [Solirubrobacterales bacterium]